MKRRLPTHIRRGAYPERWHWLEWVFLPVFIIAAVAWIVKALRWLF